MKAILRILIVFVFLIGAYIYALNRPVENDVLEGPNQVTQAIPKEQFDTTISESIPRPTSGISTYIGEPISSVIEDFAVPNRIEQSKYGFEWWIYYKEKGLLMFSVSNEKVVQVYTNAPFYTTGPYQIGQTVEDIYSKTIIEYEIAVNIEESLYLFSMSDNDLHTRLLIVFDGLYAQLYIDKVENRLVGVRYLDGETLVLQHPYEMQYMGELIKEKPKTSFDQLAINESESIQLNDLTNAIRQQYGLQPFANSPTLNELARQHSEDMFLDNYVSNESPKYGSLKDRLTTNNFEYSTAGENVATGYTDTIEAVHGWLNSQSHRNELLSEKYTYFGTGAYMDYYTQIFSKNKQKPFERN